MLIKRKTIRRSRGGGSADGGGTQTVKVGENEYRQEGVVVSLPQYVTHIDDTIADKYPDNDGKVTLPKIPRSVSVNGSTYTPDSAGDIDLGTIGGGGGGSVNSLAFNKYNFTPDASGKVDIGNAFTWINYNNDWFSAANSAQSATGASEITLPATCKKTLKNSMQKRWLVVNGADVVNHNSVVVISTTGTRYDEPKLLAVHISAYSTAQYTQVIKVVPLYGYGNIRAWATPELSTSANLIIVDLGTINVASGNVGVTMYCYDMGSQDRNVLYYDTVVSTSATIAGLSIDSTMRCAQGLLDYLATSADADDYRYTRTITIEGGTTTVPVSSVTVTTAQRLNDII